MNSIQKLSARLLGLDYAALVRQDSVEVHRVKRIGKHLVTAHYGTRLRPGGGVNGPRDQSYVTWEPLTPGAKKFYDIEVLR